MNINTISHASAAIDTAVAYGARAYAVASEVFTISAMLWCLNFMANMVEKTYVAGTKVGEFYFTYLHEGLMEILYKTIITTVSVLAWLAGYANYVYRHRDAYIAKMNDLRNYIGEAFTYRYAY